MPARIEIEPAEAAIVRRIFRAYVAGSSMKWIVFELNRDGVPFPAETEMLCSGFQFSPSIARIVRVPNNVLPRQRVADVTVSDGQWMLSCEE